MGEIKSEEFIEIHHYSHASWAVPLAIALVLIAMVAAVIVIAILAPEQL